MLKTIGDCFTFIEQVKELNMIISIRDMNVHKLKR